MGHAEVQATAGQAREGQGLARRGPPASAQALRPLASSLAYQRPVCGSRMTGDCHVRFCESRGVRFPPATHQVEGKQKQGAAFGYTKVLGYHPLLASRADTGEVLHARMRKGSANTARGARRFLDELIARVRRAGAAGEIVVRVDSGFWSKDTIATLGRLDVRYTMAVRTNTKGIAAAIAAIDDDTWDAIDYTPDGEAQVAETVYKDRRLIVRRTRLTDRRQLKLWPDWRHFAFLTDLDSDAVTIDAFHREHATNRRTKPDAVSATSRQPWSMMSECPRLGISM